MEYNTMELGYYNFIGHVKNRAKQYAQLVGIWHKDGSCQISDWFSADHTREVFYVSAVWCRCDPDNTLVEHFDFEVPFYVMDSESSWKTRALEEFRAAHSDCCVEDQEPDRQQIRNRCSYGVYEEMKRRFDSINPETSNKKYSDKVDLESSREIEREAALIVLEANQKLSVLRGKRYMAEAEEFKEKK